MALPLSGGVSIDTINTALGPTLQNQEAQFTSAISTIQAKGGEDMSQFDLIALQQQLQQLNMFVELMSTIVKSFSDSVKGVIQKSG